MVEKYVVARSGQADAALREAPVYTVSSNATSFILLTTHSILITTNYPLQTTLRALPGNHLLAISFLFPGYLLCCLRG